MQRAAQHQIGVAISNPCIELWFLLHWVDQAAYLERGVAQDRVRPHVGEGKAIAASAVAGLIERHDLARDRAQQLAARHDLNGSATWSNPSSTAWKLIEVLRAD